MNDGWEAKDLLNKWVGLISDCFAFFCISLYVSAYDAVAAFISIIVFPHFHGWVMATCKKNFPFNRALAILIFFDETNLQIINIKTPSGCSSSVSFFDHTVFITNIQHRRWVGKIAVLQLGFSAI